MVSKRIASPFGLSEDNGDQFNYNEDAGKDEGYYSQSVDAVPEHVDQSLQIIGGLLISLRETIIAGQVLEFLFMGTDIIIGGVSPDGDHVGNHKQSQNEGQDLIDGHHRVSLQHFSNQKDTKDDHQTAEHKNSDSKSKVDAFISFDVFSQSDAGS